MAILRTLNMPVSRFAQRMTMTVRLTGVRTWRVRVWLGTRLLGLAARVIGCHLHVEVGGRKLPLPP